MNRSDRLALVYLFTSIFGLLIMVIINEPFTSDLIRLINSDTYKENLPRFLFLIITIMFYMFISLYDFFVIN